MYDRDGDDIEIGLKLFEKCNSRIEDEMQIILQRKLGIKAVKI